MSDVRRIIIRITPNGAPDQDIDGLMDAFRDISRTLGYDPDVIVFKIVRPIPAPWWKRVWGRFKCPAPVG